VVAFLLVVFVSLSGGVLSSSPMCGAGEGFYGWSLAIFWWSFILSGHDRYVYKYH